MDSWGTWKCAYEIGGEQRTSTMNIKKDGDKLAGTMDWPNQEGEPLKDVKLKEGTLTFSAVRKFMDNEIPIDYTLTIDGDSSRGKARRISGVRRRNLRSRGRGRRRISSGCAVSRVPTAVGRSALAR
jgi:hypothetical protein